MRRGWSGKVTRMKIIFGTNRSEIEDHAKDTIAALTRYEFKHPTGIKPKGVQYHAARYPHTCEDCGSTFWSAEEYDYGLHPGCRKGKSKTGF